MVLSHLQSLSKWHDLGLALGLEYSLLTEIEKNHPGDVKRCLKKVVEHWLEMKGKERSWKVLHEALKDPLVQRPDIAAEIQKNYL